MAVADVLMRMSLGLICCLVLSIVFVVLGFFILIGGLIFYIQSFEDTKYAETSQDAGYIMLLLGGVLAGIALPFLCLTCWRCCKTAEKERRRKAQIDEEVSREMDAMVAAYLRDREMAEAQLENKRDKHDKEAAGPSDTNKKGIEANTSHVYPNAPPLDTSNQSCPVDTSQKETDACSSSQVKMGALELLNEGGMGASPTAPPDWKQYH